MIVVSLSNNYAVPTGWADAIAGIASGAFDRPSWPVLATAPPIVADNDPRIGRFRSSYGDFVFDVQRSADGALLLIDEAHDSDTALVPLADGSFLQPLYFQRCSADTEAASEAPPASYTCRILSGEERYTGVWTRVVGSIGAVNSGSMR